jgi:hypothetical protein
LRTDLGANRFLAGWIVEKEVEEILRREFLAKSVDAARKKELLYLRKRRALRHPDSGKIGFAVKPRGRRRKIRFALPRSRKCRIVIHGPLGVDV